MSPNAQEKLLELAETITKQANLMAKEFAGSSQMQRDAAQEDSGMVENIRSWAETASEGDYLAHYDSMTVEQVSPGKYAVTHDDSGRTIWVGMAASTQAAYDAAQEADTGSRCGWDDAELADVERILRRGNLTLKTDDRGLVASAQTIE